MLYALDHYHANMSNFPGRLSAISQVSENGSSTPLVPHLTSGFHSLERKKQLHRGSVVLLWQLRSWRENALPVTDTPRLISPLSKSHKAMATGDTGSLTEMLQLVIGPELSSEATDHHHLHFHRALLLTTLAVRSTLEELKGGGADNTHMTTPSQGLRLCL